MSDKGKSVLDGVEVKNKAFPQDADYSGPDLVCPHCGKRIVQKAKSLEELRSDKIEDLKQTK